MTHGRWWRWGGLALVGVLAAILSSFNSRERVALDLGFTTVYRIPLVPLLLAVFVAGMGAMFLLGLRHDLRVRRALRQAGFGEPIAPGEVDGEEKGWPLDATRQSVPESPPRQARASDDPWPGEMPEAPVDEDRANPSPDGHERSLESEPPPRSPP